MNTSSKISKTPNWPKRISAKRNILQRITIKDAAGWMRLNNAIKKSMPDWDSVPSVIYAKNEILNYDEEWNFGKRYVYAVFDKKTGKLIGDFHIKNINTKDKSVEFGHCFAPNMWGTGRTYEVLSAIHTIAKKRKITLRCKIEEDNIRSWKSIEKYGAKYIGKNKYKVYTRKISMRVYEL